MVGAPKHALKGIAAGVDLICAQGGEAGGHTGEVSNSFRTSLETDKVARQATSLPRFSFPLALTPCEATT